MKIDLGEVQHDQAGFGRLIDLGEATRGCILEDIEIDMQTTSWFAADMAAPFGAILYRASRNLNTVNLVNIPQRVERILSKNGFLSSYGRARIPDTWATTIQYQRCDASDDRFFAQYVETELMARSELPSMSAGLRKKLLESVFEIFSNAVLHSQTEYGIFSCGQFFPKSGRIDFSVADLGIGIRRNIASRAHLDLPPEKAIAWAVEGNNTTKAGPVPGGLGLKLLREFITLNKGRIQIVSDRGYWECSSGTARTARFAHAFPGTVVNIEINTADTSSYCLRSEISPSDVF